MLKNIRNAALSVLAPVIVLAIIEITAGMFFSDYSVFYKFHPKYLHVTKANFKRHVLNKRTKENILFRTSMLGYRGEFVQEKTRPRIVVYGDSNVQALFAKEEDTFPAKLEQTLKNNGKPFEVINAGTTGYGPDQNLLRIEDEIAILKPDVIILQVFTDNDFGDLIRNKLFDVKNDELIRRTPRLSLAVKADYYCASSYICRTLKRAALKFNSINDAVPITMTQCEQEFESYKSNDAIDFAMWRDHADIDIHESYLGTPMLEYKIRLMKLLMKELQRIHSLYPAVRFLLLIQPSTGDAPEAGKNTPFASRVLKEAAQEAEIESVDLYPRFAEAGLQWMFNNYDNHWSSRGRALAAILAAEKITEKER